MVVKRTAQERTKWKEIHRRKLMTKGNGHPDPRGSLVNPDCVKGLKRQAEGEEEIKISHWVVWIR